MRRAIPLVLVAILAFGAGVAGAKGAFDHLLGTDHVASGVGGSAATATPGTATAVVSGAGATPTSATPAVTTVATTPAAAPTMPPVAAPVPVSLAQVEGSGVSLPLGGWANASGVVLQVMAPAGVGHLRADVEVRPAGQPFGGTPTGSSTVAGGVAALAERNLPSGRYHWQARLVSGGGATPGRWFAYAHGAAAFGIQRAAPDAPVVSSPTDPHAGATYATSTVTFHWTTPPDPAGIAGYAYRLDLDPHGAAHRAVRTRVQTVSLGQLGTGTYYFHVRALDDAGNWGPSATFPVRVDVTPPQLRQAFFAGYYVDPALESLRLAYTLSKITRVTIGIYNSAGVRVRHIVPPGLKLAGVAQDVQWNGRDDTGNLVPAGQYSVYLRATDRSGNSNVFGWGGLYVTYKRIVVSLSRQRLWAYDGPHVVLTTLVTTGNRQLPTPTGLFHVMFARSPFTFHSPWPKGSPLYYPPSPVNYALYFKDAGYFIHDAPWRSAFGPGSNALSGTPGSSGTGTHGCVNVPEPVMARLYAWATPGTPVRITN